MILPKINIVADKTKYKAFEVPVNHQLFDSWSGNEHFHTLCMYRITHEDFLYRFIELDNKPLPFPLFVSSLNSIGKGPLTIVIHPIRIIILEMLIFMLNIEINSRN